MASCYKLKEPYLLQVGRLVSSRGLEPGFVNDKCLATDWWKRVFWDSNVLVLLKREKDTEISVDRDFDDEHGTGYGVVPRIDEALFTGNFRSPIIRVHSADPPAPKKIKLGTANIRRLSTRK